MLSETIQANSGLRGGGFIAQVSSVCANTLL